MTYKNFYISQKTATQLTDTILRFIFAFTIIYLASYFYVSITFFLMLRLLALALLLVVVENRAVHILSIRSSAIKQLASSFSISIIILFTLKLLIQEYNLSLFVYVLIAFAYSILSASVFLKNYLYR